MNGIGGVYLNSTCIGHIKTAGLKTAVFMFIGGKPANSLKVAMAVESFIFLQLINNAVRPVGCNINSTFFTYHK